MTMKHIKKWMTMGVAAILAAGMMAGCQPGTQQATDADSLPPSNSAHQTQTPQQDEAPTEEMELNILNWGDYIDDEVLEDFQLEYPNINVTYEMMSSNEEMLTLLQSGGSVFDVCFPSDYTIAKMRTLDLLSEIDHSQLSNLDNIDERFLNLSFDPGNVYSIPYHWGTVGILYNTTLVNEPVDSWSLLWDTRYKKQIFMYDSVRDSMAIALLRLGYSINSTDAAELKEAADTLIQQKPLVQAYGIDDLRDKMISGAGAFAVVYSGDAIDAMDQNESLDYAVPKEGSNVWFDNVIITKNSQNKTAAHIFINYLLRADVAARNAQFIGYSTPNQAAMEQLPAELVENIVFNPPEDVLARCEMFEDVGDAMNLYNEEWLRIKAAK